jgi:hypothetical protein
LFPHLHRARVGIRRQQCESSQASARRRGLRATDTHSTPAVVVIDGTLTCLSRWTARGRQTNKTPPSPILRHHSNSPTTDSQGQCIREADACLDAAAASAIHCHNSALLANPVICFDLGAGHASCLTTCVGAKPADVATHQPRQAESRTRKDDNRETRARLMTNPGCLDLCQARHFQRDESNRLHCVREPGR